MIIYVTSSGGGTGNYPVNRSLYFLKTDSLRYNLGDLEIDIATLIGILDRGGSSGKLHRLYGGIPVGDIRQAVAAFSRLSDDPDFLRQLGYRGPQNGDHPSGNLILDSIFRGLRDDQKLEGVELLRQYSKMVQERFQLVGRIIPIAIPNGGELYAEFEREGRVVGEDKIDELEEKGVPLIRDPKTVYRVGTTLPIKANPEAIERLRKSNLVIGSPGSIVTSQAQNYSIQGIPAALQGIPLYLVLNLVKPQKRRKGPIDCTDDVGFICHLMGRPPDGVIINSREPSRGVQDAYGRKNMWLACYDEGELREMGIGDIVYADVAMETEDKQGPLFRHDPEKLAPVFADLIRRL